MDLPASFTLENIVQWALATGVASVVAQRLIEYRLSQAEEKIKACEDAIDALKKEIKGEIARLDKDIVDGNSKVLEKLETLMGQFREFKGYVQGRQHHDK